MLFFWFYNANIKFTATGPNIHYHKQSSLVPQNEKTSHYYIGTALKLNKSFVTL